MDVYLIHPRVDGFTAEEVCVVKAEDYSEARNKALELYGQDEMFQEFVRDLSVNMGFVSTFFEDEDGYFVDDYGFYAQRMVELFDGDVDRIDAYVEVNVELNMRKFFGENEHFADSLMEPYLKGKKIADNLLPEMYRYILDKTTFDYYGGLVIKKIDFHE